MCVYIFYFLSIDHIALSDMEQGHFVADDHEDGRRDDHCTCICFIYLFDCIPFSFDVTIPLDSYYFHYLFSYVVVDME